MIFVGKVQAYDTNISLDDKDVIINSKLPKIEKYFFGIVKADDDEQDNYSFMALDLRSGVGKVSFVDELTRKESSKCTFDRDSLSFDGASWSVELKGCSNLSVYGGVKMVIIPSFSMGGELIGTINVYIVSSKEKLYSVIAKGELLQFGAPLSELIRKHE